MSDVRALALARFPLLLCFLVLPAAGFARKTPRTPRRHDRPVALDGRGQVFVAQATADDDLQIALAKLAMSRSANPQVRALASKIVSDQTALNLQWAQLAAKNSSIGHAHGLPPRDIRAMQAHLQSLQGGAFDRAFAGMMVKEQHKIIAAYEVAAKTSADNRLRTIAARGIPVLHRHLDAAQALMKEDHPAEDRPKDT